VSGVCPCARIAAQMRVRPEQLKASTPKDDTSQLKPNSHHLRQSLIPPNVSVAASSLPRFLIPLSPSSSFGPPTSRYPGTITGRASVRVKSHTFTLYPARSEQKTRYPSTPYPSEQSSERESVYHSLLSDKAHYDGRRQVDRLDLGDTFYTCNWYASQMKRLSAR